MVTRATERACTSQGSEDPGCGRGGIDVTKAHVDVPVLGATLDAQRFDNAPEGHWTLTAALEPLDVARVVNPRQACDSANSMGRLAKTDAVAGCVGDTPAPAADHAAQ